jgi:hypothetical protein
MIVRRPSHQPIYAESDNRSSVGRTDQIFGWLLPIRMLISGRATASQMASKTSATWTIQTPSGMLSPFRTRHGCTLSRSLLREHITKTDIHNIGVCVLGA